MREMSLEEVGVSLDEAGGENGDVIAQVTLAAGEGELFEVADELGDG
jgi:hypothetical protein